MLHRTLTRSGVAPARCPRTCRVPVARPVAPRAASTETSKKAEPVVEEEVFDDGPEVTPSTQQVATFINTLCNDTEIAEMHLKMGSFELKLKRSVAGAAPAYHAPVAHAAPAPAPAPAPAAPVEPPTMEETMDESLVVVNAPKVGIFRRGKYAGGKRVGKGNIVNQGDQVKKGQVLGYVEQLGTFVEVKTPIAGELAKVFKEDGSPVEYGERVAEVAPFFGGHIIGDSKYA